MVVTPRDLETFARDSEWFASNYEKIRGNGNKAVAIKDNAVLVEGETIEDVLMELEKLNVDAAFLLIDVIPSDDAAFIL
jgi:hypothetical protein